MRLQEPVASFDFMFLRLSLRHDSGVTSPANKDNWLVVIILSVEKRKKYRPWHGDARKMSNGLRIYLK